MLDMWRNWINSLEGDDLSEGDASDIPLLEKIPKQTKMIVQKVITVIYVYTDTDKRLFGHSAFEDIQILGEMTPEKLETLLKKEKIKRSKRIQEDS